MPRIRDRGWLRSLDRRLDDLEAEGPVGIPWDEVLSRIRWYRRGRGLLVAVGVGLRPGDRLAELVFGLLHQGHGLGAMTTEIMVGVLELIRSLPEIGHRRSDVRVALRVMPRGGWPDHSAIGLIFGGAVGNLIDRARFGAVVDFVDVYYRGWHWPAFNVADSAITVGVALLVLRLLGERSPAPSP